MPADPPPPAGIGQDARIIALIGTGHFLSHFYMLSLPPLFLFWQAEFNVSFAELGLAVTDVSDSPEQVPGMVDAFVRLREANAAAGFDTGTVKVMVDGVPHGATAALLEPYCAHGPGAAAGHPVTGD